MQYANPDATWLEWLEDNQDKDEATKLVALREIIAETARTYVTRGDISGDWANKKLAKLGVTERIGLNSYIIEAHAAGVVRVGVPASDRAEAMAEFRARTRGVSQVSISLFAVQDADADLVFVSGPDDPDVAAADPDVPTTVDATLNVFREVLLLGNIAGPRFDCDAGTNAVLASFGLPPVPARKKFTVGVPVEGVMKTTVEAYDDESAERVAGWRWDNHQTGFNIDSVIDHGNLTVTEVH